MGSDVAKAHASYPVQPSVGVGISAEPAGPQAHPATGVGGAPPAAAEDQQLHAGDAGIDETGSDAAHVGGAPPEGEGSVASPVTRTPADGSQPLIPVPTTAPSGAPLGVPLLIGGADLIDSSATLIAYREGVSVREVLHAVVAPDAEPKLMESIWLGKQQLIPVTVEKEIHGRLPADTQNQLFEQAQKLAKSINHHLKQQDGIPAHTVEGHAELTKRLDELEQAGTTNAEAGMLGHYRSFAEAMAQRLAPDFDIAYDSGGKLPMVTPYEISSTVEVTEMVPAPVKDLPPGRLAAHMRKASRISAKLGQDGTVNWDGSSRESTTGNEYAVDLGDGFQAVYRPYEVPQGRKAPAFSHRGSLEIIAPPGEGHGQALVQRLGQLHLVNRAMTAAEGEWAYLNRNIWAQNLGAHPKVKAALDTAAGLESAALEELWARRADEAVGMDEPRLIQFGKQLMLDAEAAALTHKIAALRDGVAQAKGLDSGQALLALPDYDPTPHRSGGWLEWRRFDVAATSDKVDAAFGHRGLVHRTSPASIAAMIRNGGALVCTERRRFMGIEPGVGWSEGADMNTGGAQSVFCRVEAQPQSGSAALFWAKPSRLLNRADWYAYPHDAYGALDPGSKHIHAMTRDPFKAATFANTNNEVMFRNGIDLLGPHAPTRIRAGTAEGRALILGALTDRGITELNGVPVEEVVVI